MSKAKKTSNTKSTEFRGKLRLTKNCVRCGGAMPVGLYEVVKGVCDGCAFDKEGFVKIEIDAHPSGLTQITNSFPANLLPTGSAFRSEGDDGLCVRGRPVSGASRSLQEAGRLAAEPPFGIQGSEFRRHAASAEGRLR